MFQATGYTFIQDSQSKSNRKVKRTKAKIISDEQNEEDENKNLVCNQIIINWLARMLV